MTWPRGRPPMPSAMSRAIEPVGMTFMATSGLSPRRITEPFPNCLSIWERAMSRALSRSSVAMVAHLRSSGEVVGFHARTGVRQFRCPGGSVENGSGCGRHCRPNTCSTARSTRRAVTAAPGAASALLLGHVVLLADRQPDLADGEPRVDRLQGGPAVEGGEHVVAHEALGPHRPELAVHPGPELLQAHAPTLARPRSRPRPRLGAYLDDMVPGTGSGALDVVLQIGIAAAMLVAVVLLI